MIEEVTAKLILSEKPMKIKILGDSISHGCGCNGFAEDGEIIINDPVYGIRRSSKNCNCYANLLAKYMKEVCNAEVKNYAILGTDMDYGIKFFDELIDDDDDLILIVYGANNRHEFHDGTPHHTRESWMRGFMEKIRIMNEKLSKTNADYIFVSSPPENPDKDRALSETGYTRHFHMWDVHNMLLKGSVEYGYLFLPLYTLYMDYVKASGVDIVSLREYCPPYGSVHPNDAGHRVMFEQILKGLGLAEIPGI